MNTSLPEQKEINLSDLRRQLAQNPDGVLESFARQYDLTTREATECLPPECCISVCGTEFESVMKELSTWGEILLIVHTPEAIIECAGTLPEGSFGRGFFNLGEGSPIRGHIRAEACAAICLVRRPFMGMETCSVQFFSTSGTSMFKVFIGRGADDTLLPGQVKRFEALWARFKTEEKACAQ